MADIPFQLSDYTAHIKKIADAGNLSVETATQCFIANLTTMKEHYPRRFRSELSPAGSAVEQAAQW